MQGAGDESTWCSPGGGCEEAQQSHLEVKSSLVWLESSLICFLLKSRLFTRRGAGDWSARCSPGGGGEHAESLLPDPARGRDRPGQLPDRSRLAD